MNTSTAREWARKKVQATVVHIEDVCDLCAKRVQRLQLATKAPARKYRQNLGGTKRIFALVPHNAFTSRLCTRILF